MTAKVSEVLQKALALSVEERDMLIDRLIESLASEPADAGVDAAWLEGIKRSVERSRANRAKAVPSE